MKIYFISPNDRDLRMWYMEHSNNDISTLKTINIGYNDSYEMRSQHLPTTFFSDDPTKLEEILKARKRKKIVEIYKEMLDEMRYVVRDRNTAIEHDSIDAPF